MLSKLPKIEKNLFLLLILFLPTQLGKHFWPEFSIVNGIRIDYLSPTLYFTDVLIVLLLGTWLINLLGIGKNKLKNKLNVLSKFGFQFCMLVLLFLGTTILLSDNLFGGFYSLVKFIEMSFVAYYIASACGKTVSIKEIAIVLSVGVIVQSLLAVAQFINQGSIGGLLYYLGERTFTASTPGIANASLNGELVMRAYGTFSHPNVLAGYLLISLILVFFYLFPEKKTYMRLLAVTAIFLGTAALLLTLSRIAIPLWMCFVFLVFILQLVKKKSIKQTMFKIFTFIALVAFCWILFSQFLTPRFLETTLFEEALVQRQLLADAAVAMILSNPLFGIGLGNFLPTLGMMQTPLSLALYLQPVHNIFLLAGAELGLVGLGVLIWFLGTTVVRQIRKKSLPLLLCLLVIVVTGLADHYWLTLQQGQILFALVIGLCWQTRS